MVFSRYTRRFEKDGVTAFYHSLRMLPVYMPASSAEIITRHVAHDGPASLPPALERTVKRLVDAKIIIPSRVFDDFVIAKVRETLRPPEIKIAYFILTEDCNFDCSYCYVKDEMPPGHKTRTMSIETARSGVAAYARFTDSCETDQKMIILYGGEPLLNFEVIKEIVLQVERYKAEKRLPENVQILVITNGSLLSASIAAFFREHQVQISVSLDGDQEASDSCRVFADGQGSFNEVMAGIRTAREQGCDVSLSVTMSESCLERFDKTLEIIDEIACKDFGFNMMTVQGPKEMELAEQTSDALIKAYQYFRPKGVKEDRMMRKVSAFSSAKIYAFDCAAAGANQITIAPEGAIGLCHVQTGSRTDFTGHVNNPAFDPKNDAVFLEWNRRTPLTMPQCQDCCALGICGGGCPYNARRKHGSIWDMDDRFCVHAKKTLEWLIWELFYTKIEPELAGIMKTPDKPKGENDGVT
jgi:uncharacterized protein